MYGLYSAYARIVLVPAVAVNVLALLAGIPKLYGKALLAALDPCTEEDSGVERARAGAEQLLLLGISW